MGFVAGVDPGIGGAIAAMWEHDPAPGYHLDIFDMPNYNVPIGKTTKRRIDVVSLLTYFETLKGLGCDLVVMEAVGGRPRQSASSAFTFGWSTCAVYVACVANRIPVETVASQTWKKLLRVPGKTAKKKGEDKPKLEGRELDQAIIQRADELMPEYRRLWRNERGTLKVDRAEAAMIARYAMLYAIRNIRPDAEWRLTYQKAEAGL